MTNKWISIVILGFIYYLHGYSQELQKGPSKENQVISIHKDHQLYQFGHADAFVNGLYKGILPVNELESQGDFGLGAPDMVNGELTINEGKAYQTTADGSTFQTADTMKIPFAMVTFFRSDTSVVLSKVASLDDLYAQLSQQLKNKNAMYAIRIKGAFETIKTRAFPQVKEDGMIPLAQMLDKQQFFDYQRTKGSLIGFWMPSYLAGINITGFHFHFLSSDTKYGGHLLQAVSSQKVVVEISKLEDFLLQVPDDATYQHYPFVGENNTGLKKVEKGSE